MKIYIASSFRNLMAVLLLRDALAALGHTVLDWTQKAPPLPENMNPAERRFVLDSDERGDIYDFCAAACTSADLVVFLEPAGKDAACEAAMAMVSGPKVYGLSGPLDKPGLILHRCADKWFSTPAALLEAVENLQFELANPEQEEV